MKNNKAFTMVELLGTITILGILMGIAVIAISSYLDKGRENYIKNQKKTLITAAQQYYNINPGALPEEGATSTITYSTLKSGKYIGKVYAADRKTECTSAKVETTKTNGQYTYEAILSC